MSRPVSTGINAVRRRRADGTITQDFYHRRTGRLIGREREGMTRERAIAIARELDTEAEAPSGPPAGSFGELTALYLGSTAFRNLAPGTQREYHDHIEILRGAWERVPLEGITRKAVAALHARYADRPWRGNAVLRTLRLVLNYGRRDLELRQLQRNPVDGFAMHATPARDQVWPAEKIEAFVAAAEAIARPRLRKAIALLLYTVQRPSDVLAMARPQLRRDAEGRVWIRLRQAKTGALVDVPCHRRLAEELARPDPPLRGRADGSLLLLPSPTGKRWSYRNFARSWDHVAARANLRLAREAIAARGGLPHRVREPVAHKAAKRAVRTELLAGLQRRDLRRTGAVQMALAGATTAQIAALAGWSIDRTQRIIDTYVPRRGEVALGGVERWEEMGRATPSPAARMGRPEPK
jgi:hypothetical protein